LDSGDRGVDDLRNKGRRTHARSREVVTLDQLIADALQDATVSEGDRGHLGRSRRSQGSAGQADHPRTDEENSENTADGEMTTWREHQDTFPSEHDTELSRDLGRRKTGGSRLIPSRGSRSG
jgi:hypothetical protein